MKFADLQNGDNFSFIDANDSTMGIIWQKIPMCTIKGLNGQTLTFNAISTDCEGNSICIEYVVEEHEIFPQPLNFWFDIFLERPNSMTGDEYITEILADTPEAAIAKYRKETGDNSPDIFAVKREML